MLYTEPQRAIPWTATDEPILAKLLNAREDPRCKKSNTDVEDPNLEIPVIETEEPNREKERIEKLLPKCTKSRIHWSTVVYFVLLLWGDGNLSIWRSIVSPRIRNVSIWIRKKGRYAHEIGFFEWTSALRLGWLDVLVFVPKRGRVLQADSASNWIVATPRCSNRKERRKEGTDEVSPENAFGPGKSSNSSVPVRIWELQWKNTLQNFLFPPSHPYLGW